MPRRTFVDNAGRVLYSGLDPAADKVARVVAAGGVELPGSAGDPPTAHIWVNGAWTPPPQPPELSTEEKQSRAINARVSLASLAEIIGELANVVPIQQAPKLHALKNQIAAIKGAVDAKA